MNDIMLKFFCDGSHGLQVITILTNFFVGRHCILVSIFADYYAKISSVWEVMVLLQMWTVSAAE